jgi:polysaccharide deacetylase family protein (PEP-CTERM system associated)
MTNYLSIDVEDYFQVSAFEKVSPPETWNRRELRVERNTEKVLGILAEFSVKGTFFVLGWVAERCPELVKKIAAEGHEVASHGYGHQRVPNQGRGEFRQDVRRSKAILEALTGREVIGYRAPSYSISKETFWAFDELHEAGYRYDSSIFPIRHDFYGIPEWPRFAGYAVKVREGNWTAAAAVEGRAAALFEVPITTLRFAGRNLPVAGGGYFRLFPYAFTRWGLSRINKKENKPFVFYLHPWELDPEQPRMRGISAKSRFRHYLSLDKTEKRFRQLLRDFDFVPVSECIAVKSESADCL